MPFSASRISGLSENIIASQTIAAAGTTFSAAIPNMSVVQNVVLQSNVTAISGTAPSIVVTLQDTVDGGTNWNDVQALTSQTATGVVVARISAVFSDQVRFKYVVAGTLPSVTFRIDWYTETASTLSSGA